MLPASMIRIPAGVAARPSGRTASWHGGRWRIRIGLILILMTAACIWAVGAARADCINYEDYLHWVAGVDTPGSSRNVAVLGNYAYVVDYVLRIFLRS